MKTLIKLIIFLVVIVIIAVGAMFFFKICPPVGPWPMPPWCADQKYEPVFYETEYEAREIGDMVWAVDMNDTWGQNYNFAMFESTRNNINSSFDRVYDLGANEVYVRDFHRAIYDGDTDFKSLNYTIEDEVFANDFRDESISEKDVKRLAEAAHLRGMKLGIKHNMAFVDIGKYINEAGNIGERVTEDFNAFNQPHSEEWVRDWFGKWQARLVERAKIYEIYGVDIMGITPNWMGPTFQGQEELANELWKELISSLREVYSGEILVQISDFGFVDGKNGDENWEMYDYYTEADIVELDFYAFMEAYKTAANPDKDQIKASLDKYLDTLEIQAKANDIKLSFFYAPFSYSNGINEGIIEFHDFLSDALTSIQKDWDHQADAYQAMFEALEGRENIERFIVGGFWWDDAMDPSVKVRISLSPSPRNKPAEAVIKKWFSQ